MRENEKQHQQQQQNGDKNEKRASEKTRQAIR